MSVIRSLRFLAGLLAAALVLLGPGIAPAAATSTTPSRFVLTVPVLFYHHVLCPPADATFPSLYTCPEQFAAQLTYLRDHGWRTLTIDQVADLLADRQCPDPKAVVVSFDDGTVDQYDNAAPILESLGMRGTFFVTTGREAGALRPGKIPWDGLRDLIARGHAIGNHSKTHANEKKLDAAGLYDQIEVSEGIFEQQLGFRPRTFAYPYGRYNDAVIAQVAASGFELAFTVHAGARESTELPFLSKRIAVFQEDSGADVLAMVQPFMEGCRPATPDLAISSTNSGPWKGEDVHSSVAVKTQTLKRTGVHVGTTYHYFVRLGNDAQRAGTFKVTTVASGGAGMSIRYFVGGVERTSAISAGTYVTPTMEPWSTLMLDIRITPSPSVPPGNVTTVSLRAASSTDGLRVDVVKAVAAL
jgi:peptidoglycan/xylan/chitin deacetylase (PgdA/CDA1 family)